MVTLLNGGLSYRTGIEDLMRVWDASVQEHTLSKQNEASAEATWLPKASAYLTSGR